MTPRPELAVVVGAAALFVLAAGRWGWSVGRVAGGVLGILGGAAATWLLAPGLQRWWDPAATELPRPVVAAMAALILGFAVLALDRLGDRQGAWGGGMLGAAVGAAGATGSLPALSMSGQVVWAGGGAQALVAAGAAAGLLVGAGWAWMPYCPGRKPRWLLALGAWLAAATALELGGLGLTAARRGDAVWLPWALAILLLLGAGVGAMVIRYSQDRILLRELSAEAVLGVIPPWLAGVAPRVEGRAMARCWPRRSERVVLVSMLTRLALLRLELKRFGTEERSLHGIEVGRLRARLRALLVPPSRHEAADA